MMRLRELDIEEVGKCFYRHCTDPKALYVTLIERWWMLVVCCAIGIAVGLVAIKTTTKQFAAHGKLLVYQKLATFMDDSTRVPDPKAYDSLFATHVHLMGSPLIVDKAVADYGLAELEHIDALHAEHRRLGDKSVGDMIRENLNVGRAGSGDSSGAFVVSVEFKHVSAKECPLVVDAILRTYKSYVNDSVLDEQSKAVGLMEQFKTKLETEVAGRATTYRNFLKQAPDVWDRDTQTNTHQKLVDAFKVELTDLEIKRQAVETRINILDASSAQDGAAPLSDLQRLALVDDMHLPRLEILVSVKQGNRDERLQSAYPQLQEIASARFDTLMERIVELNAISANVGKNHPTYQDTLADVQLLTQEIDKRAASSDSNELSEHISAGDLVAAYELLLTQEKDYLDKRIEFVNKRIDEEIAASKSLYDFSIQAEHLKDELVRSQDLSRELMDKMQKQSLLSQFGSYVAEIVEHPHKGQLVWPKKPVILALCTICGFFIGSILALGLDLVQISPLASLFWFIPDFVLRDRFSSSTPSTW